MLRESWKAADPTCRPATSAGSRARTRPLLWVWGRALHRRAGRLRRRRAAPAVRDDEQRRRGRRRLARRPPRPARRPERRRHPAPRWRGGCSCGRSPTATPASPAKPAPLTGRSADEHLRRPPRQGRQPPAAGTATTGCDRCRRAGRRQAAMPSPSGCAARTIRSLWSSPYAAVHRDAGAARPPARPATSSPSRGWPRARRSRRRCAAARRGRRRRRAVQPRRRHPRADRGPRCAAARSCARRRTGARRRSGCSTPPTPTGRSPRRRPSRRRRDRRFSGASIPLSGSEERQKLSRSSAGRRGWRRTARRGRGPRRAGRGRGTGRPRRGPSRRRRRRWRR